MRATFALFRCFLFLAVCFAAARVSGYHDIFKPAELQAMLAERVGCTPEKQLILFSYDGEEKLGETSDRALARGSTSGQFRAMTLELAFSLENIVRSAAPAGSERAALAPSSP